MAQPELQALLSQGLAHFSKGQHEEAKTCWNKVLEADPANVRAREYLAYIRTSSPPVPARHTSPPAVVSPSLLSVPPTPSVMSEPPTPAALAVPPTPSPVAPAPVRRALEEPPATPMVATPSISRAPEAEPPKPVRPSSSIGMAAQWFTEVPQTQTSSMPLAPLAPPPVRTNTASGGPAKSGDPLLEEVLTTWNAELSHALPQGMENPPVRDASTHVGALGEDGSRAARAFEDVTITPVPQVVRPPSGGPARPKTNPFAPENTPVTGSNPTVGDGTTRSLPQTGDANADGLNGLWSAPQVVAAPVTPAVAASPWDDDGPNAAPVLVLDALQGAVKDGKNGAAAAGKARKPMSQRPMVPTQAPKGDIAAHAKALMERVRHAHSLGDFSGSLEAVEKVLELDEKNAEARDYLRENESTLIRMYESKLGSLEQVPRIAMAPDEVVWLNLHHKAGFILSRVDAMASFDDILALSGMPRLETLRILAQLLQTGVIGT